MGYNNGIGFGSSGGGSAPPPVSENYQQVLDTGNTSTTPAIHTQAGQTATLDESGVVVENGAVKAQLSPNEVGLEASGTGRVNLRENGVGTGIFTVFFRRLAGVVALLSDFIMPANTIRANATTSTATGQDVAVNPNSSLGRVDELNSGNIGNIPYQKMSIQQGTLVNGAVTFFDTRITASSVGFPSITNVGTISSVPLRVSVPVAGQMLFSNGQIGDNALINVQIYF